MFYYAGVMYVASLTGRRPFLLTSKRTTLDKAFDLDIARKDRKDRCPVDHFYHRYIYGYDNRVKYLSRVSANVSVRLHGYFFSWRYVQPVDDLLRRRLQFRRKLTEFVGEFLRSNVPRGWNASAFVRVGVHVRRGDFLGSWAVGIGLTVASRHYLYRALAYFVRRYPRVQFIVASNDIAWCKNNIKRPLYSRERVSVIFSVRHSTEQDFALLASCNHTIMSTGNRGVVTLIGTYSRTVSW